MINSIEMRNWKTHEDTKIEFSRGTNILVGMMGAGKSSTIDAICYGLFGTFPSVKQKRVKLSQIIKNRPNQEKEASVKVVFTAEDSLYCVERWISLNGAGKATLTKNGEYLQSQPERVNEEISRILKVDYDLFARAVYSEQNKLDYFLELKAKERKDQMDELLGLDKFALASDNVGSLINKIRDMVSNQKKDAAQLDLESVKNQLSGLRLELEKIEANGRRIAADLDLTNSSANVLEVRIRELRDLEAKKNIIAKEIAELKSKLEYASLEAKKIEKKNLGNVGMIVSEAKAARSRLMELKEKEKKVADLERAQQGIFSGIVSELHQLEKKATDRDAILKKIDGRDLNKFEMHYGLLTKEVQQAETELLTCVSERKNSEKWLGGLKEHIGKCPVCERDMGQDMHDKLVADKEKALNDASKKIVDLERRLEAKRSEAKSKMEAVNELKVLSERINEYRNVDKSREEMALEKEKAKSSLDTCRSGLEEIRAGGEKANEELSRLERAKEEMARLEGYLKEVVAFKHRKRLKEAEFDGIRVDAKETERLHVDFVEMRSKASALSAQVEAHMRYADDKRAQIKDKEAQAQNIERINKDIKHKEVAIDGLSRFKSSLDETKLVLRNKLVKGINEVMQEMWPELYPYGDYKSIMLDATPDDYTLNVLISKDGEDLWQEVDGIASGGERSTACLALRVAFSMVLVPNLKWIILDEPTHNIDEDGIRRFVELFNDKLPRIVDQIFIITHDELLKQSVNSNIYVLAREKGGGGPTTVERA